MQSQTTLLQSSVKNKSKMVDNVTLKSLILSCIHVCCAFMGIFLIYAEVKHSLRVFKVESPMQYPICMELLCF